MHAVKSYGGGGGIQLHSFVNSVLERDEPSAFHPIHSFTPENPPISIKQQVG
jgi:hypothetical protein